MSADASKGLSAETKRRISRLRWSLRFASMRKCLLESTSLFVLVVAPLALLGSLFFVPLLLLNELWWIESTLKGLGIVIGSWVLFGWWLHLDGQKLVRIWGLIYDILQEKQRTASIQVTRIRRHIRRLERKAAADRV